MDNSRQRIYKYDNVKALLILLVVIGHMTTDYVSDSYMVRWITLWIYSFHMPAFIFISGLVHKQYITGERASLGVRGETHLRADKVLGFFFCACGLKIFLQLTRTLMGQHPLWHWIEEPGIPWYLFVMAEYELLFWVLRHIDGGAGRRAGADAVSGGRGSGRPAAAPCLVIAAAFALSAAAGYFPRIDDTFCLSRMISFLPIYALGYYMDMRGFLDLIEGRRGLFGKPASVNQKRILTAAGWMVIAASLVICRTGGWNMYRWRKWFTGRRSYEFLQDLFSNAVSDGWWIRLLVWAAAIVLTLAVIAVVPDRDMGFVTVTGARTLQVYFWHRPVCYLFRNWKVLPRLFVLMGGVYDETTAGVTPGHAFAAGKAAMAGSLAVYVLIGAAMTAFFSLRVFGHPSSELMAAGARIAKAGHRK